MDRLDFYRLSRRELFRLGSAGVVLGARALRAAPMAAALLPLPQAACGVNAEVFPVSPLILTPFKDELPIPKALRPTPQSVYTDPAKWAGGAPGPGNQDSTGKKHQIGRTSFPGSRRTRWCTRSSCR